MFDPCCMLLGDFPPDAWRLLVWKGQIAKWRTALAKPLLGLASWLLHVEWQGIWENDDDDQGEM